MDDYKASPLLIPDIPGILVESPSKSQECRFALSMLTASHFSKALPNENRYPRNTTFYINHQVKIGKLARFRARNTESEVAPTYRRASAYFRGIGINRCCSPGSLAFRPSNWATPEVIISTTNSIPSSRHVPKRETSHNIRGESTLRRIDHRYLLFSSDRLDWGSGKISTNSSLQETPLGLVMSPAALLGSPDRIIVSYKVPLVQLISLREKKVHLVNWDKGKYAPGLPPEPEEGNSIDRKSSRLSTLELAFRLRRLNVRLIELSTCTRHPILLFEALFPWGKRNKALAVEPSSCPKNSALIGSIKRIAYVLRVREGGKEKALLSRP
ncbi:Uncharacterized protein Fot_56473 [Forsythia ovata]|uniref:Uncharacterized protein n=1 Tax=Forsythia ovata TaxID=205694 RepID=A0ABD1NZL9_9LAMI